MPVPLQLMRAPQGARFNRGQPSRFARECSPRDQARKPEAPVAHDGKINFCEDAEDLECTGPVFCSTCGLTEHSVFQFQNVELHEDSAYSLWDETPPNFHITSDNEMSRCYDQRK